MPDHRTHRGPHPEDAELFAPSTWPGLREATADLSWLLSRGYAMPSSLTLVGDRFALNQRQRIAVMRCACSDAARIARASREIAPAQLAGQTLLVDGFNVLTTIEVALGGAVILVARDGCYRDIASVHGTFRRVEETGSAVDLLGTYLASVRPTECIWYLDAPVGNSGRLRGTLLAHAQQNGWPWKVELVMSPDKILSAASERIVATADSVILDTCGRWLNLARYAVDWGAREARIVSLKGDEET